MKIERIEGYVLSSPYGDGNVFGQPKGVKSIAIVEIQVSGLVGYGESYAGVYAPELFVKTVKFLADRIINKKIEPYHEIIEALNVPFVGESGFMRSVIGAFDIAFKDVTARACDMPLYQTLSSSHEKNVQIYASGGSVVYTKEQIKEEVEYVKDCGIEYYKLRCGLQSLDKDSGRIKAAFETMDESFTIMVDFIQGTLKNMRPEEILYAVDELNEWPLYWVEELVRPHHLELLQKVKEKSLNPIAMGEHLTNELEFRNYVPLVDFIQPDVTQCGGFNYLDQILLSFPDTDVAMHCWGSSISFMSNLSAAFVHDAIMEYPMVELEINKHICLYEEMDLRKGLLLPPKFPGLGIHISDEVKEKYKFVEGSGYKI